MERGVLRGNPRALRMLAKYPVTELHTQLPLFLLAGDFQGYSVVACVHGTHQSSAVFVEADGRDMSQSFSFGALLFHATGLLGDPQNVDAKLPCSLGDMTNVSQLFPVFEICLSSLQQHQQSVPLSC